MNKNSKGFVHIIPLLIVALLLIFGVGYYAYKNGQIKLNPSQKQSESPSSPMPYPTENWETYTNTLYGYSLRYPPELTINSYEQVEGEEKIVGFNNDIDSISFTLNVSELQIDKDFYASYKFRYEDSLNGNQSPDTVSGTTPIGANLEATSRKILIASYEAYQIELTSDKSFASNTLFNKDGVIYMFQFLSKTSSDKNILDQILSTFKFLDDNNEKTQPIIGDGCVVGGCNSELCQDADEEPLTSICLYKPEHACYNSATCERQTSGKCGWTQTEELKSCLSQY